MKKCSGNLMAIMLSAFFSITAFTQTVTISGNVRNDINKQPIPAVSVLVRGSTSGTFTNDKGNFKLATSKKLPFSISVSSIGYETREIQVTNASEPIQVDLTPGVSLGQEVVISASRIPERILESPVSIERINIATIRNAPVTDYYNLLKNLKGVDLTYSSLTYATPSTRGFNGSGNARFNQFVDGHDNQAPGLNFSVGSVVGLTELDVENMELLPGASSALYGSGGMNGTLLITSKNPFKYQGLSYQVKMGIKDIDKGQRDKPSLYHDWSVRWAQKVTEKFAFKIGAQLIQAKDWIARDISDYLAGNAAFNTYGNVKSGTRKTDPGYDGVNVYGDETFTNLDALFKQPLRGQIGFATKANYAANPIPGGPPSAVFNSLVDAYLSGNRAPIDTFVANNVSRTGYQEREVIDNNTLNFRLSGGAYYKIKDNLELSLSGYWGTGNTVYTGSDRYSLKDLKMGQYKLELKHDNWFVRAYTTQENAGESYNATITTRIFNEKWKPSATAWYPTYAVAYLTSLVLGQDAFNSHSNARASADIGRPVPGSDQFIQLFDQVRKTPISKGGGLFLDKSNLYQVDGQYNFSNKIKIFDLIVGGNWKEYVLNSEGTLFADTAGKIKINEYGVYAQIAKSILNQRLKLTAAGRYDFMDNFDPRFTPRFTAVYKIAENHNLRLSYQTAYRFPTTQNQWINLVVGGGTFLIGGLPQFHSFYQFDTRPIYTIPNVIASALAGPNPALLQPVTFPKYKPETATSYEAGYKGLFAKKFLVDVYAYTAKYENFLGRRVFVRAIDNTIPTLYGGLANSNLWQVFSVAVNSQNNVTVYGYGGSVDWLLPKNFVLSANISSDRISGVDSGFVSFFNVPSYRLNVGLSNSGFGIQNRFGFAVNVRNQDGFFYESDFRQGFISGYTTVDAQISFKLPGIRSIVKIGGTNIGNNYYKTAFANPEIGGLYYVSFGYNVY